MRALKPCFFWARRFFGWKVRFGITAPYKLLIFALTYCITTVDFHIVGACFHSFSSVDVWVWKTGRVLLVYFFTVWGLWISTIFLYSGYYEQQKRGVYV